MEGLLINPRRKRRGGRRRRRSNARSTHRRRRRRARRNPFAMAPRRRRRRARGRARRSARRRHRNPRLPLIGNVNWAQIGAAGAGFLATRYGASYLFNMLPPDWKSNAQTAPMVKLGTKALVGLVVLPMVAKALKLRGIAGAIAMGAGAALVVDLFETYIAPSIPGLTVGDYETQQISEYETAQLTGSAYGAGAYGGSPYTF